MDQVKWADEDIIPVNDMIHDKDVRANDILPDLEILNDKWTFLYDDAREKKEYELSADGEQYVYFGKPVIEFNTAQKFWSIYNNIKFPVALEGSIQYKFYLTSHIDEHVVTEEDYYEKLDYIKISLPKINNRTNIQINDLFLWVLLLAIGNILCDENIVVGISFSHNVRDYQVRILVSDYKQENIDQIKERLLTPVAHGNNNNILDFSVDMKNVTIKLTEFD